MITPRVIDPEIWTKLVGRVRGANFGAIYGKTKAMGYCSITLPEGHTWKSYTQFLLYTLPARLRNNNAKKFNISIHFWHETGGGLPEETIRELMFMCRKVTQQFDRQLIPLFRKI